MLKLYLIAFFAIVISCGKGDDEKGPKVNPTNPSPLPPVTPNPTTPTIPQIPSGNIAETQQFISFHKLKRCWHSVPNVRWNESIASTARDYAKQCIFEKDQSIQGVYGENIAHGKGLGIIKAQDDWYMQFLQFPFGNKDGNDYTREFTQMVWKSTTEIGCAFQACGEENLVICRYAPIGNRGGQFAENVFPLAGDLTHCGLF